MGEQIVFFFGIVFVAFLCLYFGIPMIVGSFEFWVRMYTWMKRIRKENRRE